MAKRPVFEIKFDNNVVIKNAHNSSIREIEKIVGGIAKEEKTTYNLIKSEAVERTVSGITKSVRVWKGDNGRIIEFVVCKVN